MGDGEYRIVHAPSASALPSLRFLPLPSSPSLLPPSAVPGPVFEERSCHPAVSFSPSRPSRFLELPASIDMLCVSRSIQPQAKVAIRVVHVARVQNFRRSRGGGGRCGPIPRIGAQFGSN